MTLHLEYDESIYSSALIMINTLQAKAHGVDTEW